jgi:hypothetical protein
LRAHSTAIAHERCYGVGIAGRTLGGGVGFNLRTGSFSTVSSTAAAALIVGVLSYVFLLGRIECV